MKLAFQFSDVQKTRLAIAAYETLQRYAENGLESQGQFQQAGFGTYFFAAGGQGIRDRLIDVSCKKLDLMSTSGLKDIPFTKAELERGIVTTAAYEKVAPNAHNFGDPHGHFFKQYHFSTEGRVFITTGYDLSPAPGQKEPREKKLVGQVHPHSIEDPHLNAIKFVYDLHRIPYLLATVVGSFDEFVERVGSGRIKEVGYNPKGIGTRTEFKEGLYVWSRDVTVDILKCVVDGTSPLEGGSNPFPRDSLESSISVFRGVLPHLRSSSFSYTSLDNLLSDLQRHSRSKTTPSCPANLPWK